MLTWERNPFFDDYCYVVALLMFNVLHVEWRNIH